MTNQEIKNKITEELNHITAHGCASCALVLDGLINDLTKPAHHIHISSTTPDGRIKGGEIPPGTVCAEPNPKEDIKAISETVNDIAFGTKANTQESEYDRLQFAGLTDHGLLNALFNKVERSVQNADNTRRMAPEIKAIRNELERRLSIAREYRGKTTEACPVSPEKPASNELLVDRLLLKHERWLLATVSETRIEELQAAKNRVLDRMASEGHD